MRQELDVPGGDVVHRADDRDPPVPDEVAEGLALLEELLDDTRHVAAGHGIDESPPSRAAGSCWTSRHASGSINCWMSWTMCSRC